jgi:hypothetical protein
MDCILRNDALLYLSTSERVEKLPLIAKIVTLMCNVGDISIILKRFLVKLYLQEFITLLTIDGISIKRAFLKEWVDCMVNNTYASSNTDMIRHLFITFNPSAGKERGHYALTSMFFTDDGQRCVV